jgi:hypothetical protein
MTKDSGGQFWKRLNSIKGYNARRRKRIRVTVEINNGLGVVNYLPRFK